MSETVVCGVSTLREAAKEVFSTMVFMNIEPIAQIEENFSQEGCIIGTVAFSGKLEGALTILCGQACAKAITMNLLALDSEDQISPSDIADAIGEVSNMVMGSVKSRIYEHAGELSVSVPAVFSGKMMTPELRAGQVKISTTVALDDTYCLEVHFVYMDGVQDDE
jgi:chemotaxis protein CheX